MRFPGILGAIASLVVLASAAKADDTDFTALGGSQAIKALIGYTITVVGGPDGPVSMYVGSDNTFDVLKKGEISSGEWFEKDHLFCIKNESPCSDIIVLGSRTQGFLISGGNSHMFTMETGNQVDDSAAK